MVRVNGVYRVSSFLRGNARGAVDRSQASSHGDGMGGSEVSLDDMSELESNARSPNKDSVT